MEFVIGNIKSGVGEHVPKVALPDAFIHRESRNVRRHLGYYKKMRGRLPAIYDSESNQIAAPKYVWPIISIGADYFEISGTHAAEFTAENNTPVRVNGSTGNDGLYTVGSVSEVSGNTRIAVNEAIVDATVDGNVFLGSTRVLEYHKHTKESSGVEYLLLGTAYHALLWEPSGRTLTVKFTCSTPANVIAWSFASFQDQVFGTNGDDLVQVWDVHTSASGDFANVDGVNGIEIAAGVYCTKAKFVTAFEGYLLLGYTFENGAWCPRRLRWCDAWDPIEWNEDDAGDQGSHDLADDEGFVNGFGGWYGYLEVAGTKRMVRMWVVTTDEVFQFVKEPVAVGCLASKSLVSDKMGRLYFLASDLTIRQLDSAEAIFRPIEQTIKGINKSAAWDARAIYSEELDKILFAVPSNDSETNDMVIEFNPETKDYYFRDIAVSAFGQYSRQETYTYGTLPYQTYSDWGAAWLVYNGTANIVGYPLIICGDYSGLTYEFEQADRDAGDEISGELVFGTALDGRLHGFKRISEPLVLVFDREDEGKTATVYAKRDTEKAWITLGTISLSDASNAETVFVPVPCDLRFRHITFKIVSSDPFSFWGMYIRNYDPDGDR